jgi:restriction endonuclease S subunit
LITVRKRFTLKKSELNKKLRVENNNLDISALVAQSGVTAKKIGEIGFTHREERDRKATGDSTFRYVQISDIDVHLGRIKSYRSFTGTSAPNNARRIMKHGDVLVSTRRPTRGAVVAVPEEFDGHICTVFIATIRVKNWEEVDPRYLALFLRTSLGRYQFQSMITETAYPVITDDDVENLTVLYPAIEIQRKIATEYEAAVDSFFGQMNSAYATLVGAQQSIESAVLGTSAEVLSVPRFGLAYEEASADDEESGDET